MKVLEIRFWFFEDVLCWICPWCFASRLQPTSCLCQFIGEKNTTIDQKKMKSIILIWPELLNICTVKYVAYKSHSRQKFWIWVCLYDYLLIKLCSIIETTLHLSWLTYQMQHIHYSNQTVSQKKATKKIMKSSFVVALAWWFSFSRFHYKGA